MSSIFLSPDDWQSATFRLVLALGIGFAIGINRQRIGRPAGVRTFMIISLGAALFVMLPLQTELAYDFSDPNSASYIAYSTSLNAMTRSAQGVATGIGFLGGGVILQQRRQHEGTTEIKGLTTAASIWLAGGLGAAAGCGLWQISLVGTLLSLLILSGVKRLNRWEWWNVLVNRID